MTQEDNRSAANSRGSDAAPSGHVPANGWRDVLLRVKNAIGEDRLSLIAAGVGFFAFLSIFPALTAVLSVYGLVSDPSQVAHQVGSLRGTMPASTLQLIQKQMASISQGNGSSLGIALVASVLIAIYSASKGMGAVVSALNIAFDEREERSFIKLKLLTLLYTLVAICFVVILLGVIGLTTYLQHLGGPDWLGLVLQIVCWSIMLALMVGAIIALYARTPSRPRPPVRQVAPGALLATVIWLIVSIAFSFYISHFGNYNKTYGSLAAIVVLMLWFWISAFVILLGAEFNAALHHPRRSRDNHHLADHAESSRLHR